MANTVYLQDFAPGVESDEALYTRTNVQSDSRGQYTLLDLINPAKRSKYDYATFENSGIDLKRTDNYYLDGGTASSIADCTCNYAVSTILSDASGNVSNVMAVDIEFTDGNYTLDKGMYIYLYKPIIGKLYIKFYGVSQTTTTINVTFNGETEMYIPSSAFPFTTKIYELVFQFGGSGTSQTVDPFTFMGIRGIDFGKTVEMNAIVGEINIFSEISLTLDDAPGSSCDITVVSYESQPEKGQKILVNTPYIQGRYTIDESTRKAENTYELQCYDDVESLGNSIANASSSDSAFTDAAELVDASTVRWSTIPNGTVYGYVGSNYTCRQAVCNYGLALGCAVSSFNDVLGIHLIDISSTAVDWTLTDDKIIGRAEYKEVQDYKGAYLEYSYNGESSESSIARPATYANINLGLYKVTNSKMWNTADGTYGSGSVTPGYVMRYLNGAEITLNILYEGQAPGDIVLISTPYNGEVTAIIRSVELTIGSNSTIAQIIAKEVTS